MTNANGDTFYYVTNYRGDVVRIVDENGATVANYSYDPWGKVLSVSENTAVAGQPLGYAGYYYDKETKLYYLQARYYDPETARFVSRDAFSGHDTRPLTQNLYLYCESNPVMYYDPDGNDAIWITAKNGAHGFGHTSLLIQRKDGSWYYFYWGGRGGKPHGTAEVYLRKVPSGNVKDLGKLNKWLKDNGLPGGKYTSAVYIKGNFEGSYSYAKKLLKPSEKYDVFYNNCMQKSAEVLARGTRKGKPILSDFQVDTLKRIRIPRLADDVIRGWKDW